MLTDDERIKLESEAPYWFKELFITTLKSGFLAKLHVVMNVMMVFFKKLTACILS